MSREENNVVPCLELVRNENELLLQVHPHTTRIGPRLMPLVFPFSSEHFFNFKVA